VALSAKHFEAARRRMECPAPRVALGLALRGVATSAIDVSDGLLGDLRHVLSRSAVGATVQADAVPRSAVLAAQTPLMQRLCTLAGGDDYELLFTAPTSEHAAVLRAAASAGVAVARIGQIEAEPGLRVVDAHGRAMQDPPAGFDHFG
jgi:thiamine-monophosphate kinase